MEIIIEEKTPQHQEENLEPGGLDPFKDFKLPTFTRQPQPPPQKPQQPHSKSPLYTLPTLRNSAVPEPLIQFG